MRMAALADEHGCAAPFVLAATRLAYCGGFDLDDPEILAEAAAPADLDFDLALEAAGEAWRDLEMERAALRLLRMGAPDLPTAIVDRLAFPGEARLGEAAAAAAAAACAAVGVRRGAAR
jgi:2-hydroxychromene-2-carboxylate isomerase